MSIEKKPVRTAIARGDKILNEGSVQHSSCLTGAYCGHAILTVEIGVYRCPFGACFKKLANQKREAA